MLIKQRLQGFHLGTHRFLGVGLHSGVQGGVDFEPVPVQVVGFAFGVYLGFDPFAELLAQVFPKVGGGSRRMGLGPETQGQRHGAVTVSNFLVQKPVFDHLPDDGISTVDAAVRVTNRRIKGDAFEKSYQQGGFVDIQGMNIFVKIGAGRRANSKRVVPKFDRIQVHGQNFLFGVPFFELDGNDPFLDFLENAGWFGAGPLPVKEVEG